LPYNYYKAVYDLSWYNFWFIACKNARKGNDTSKEDGKRKLSIGFLASWGKYDEKLVESKVDEIVDYFFKRLDAFASIKGL